MGVHNFKHTQVIAGGVIITGYADGDAIKAEPNEDKWSQSVGAGGDVTYNESSNETGTVTLTLKPSSSSIPHLRALYKSGEKFNVLIQDTELNVRVTGEDCRIQKWPAFGRAEEESSVEFAILCAHYKED